VNRIVKTYPRIKIRRSRITGAWIMCWIYGELIELSPEVPILDDHGDVVYDLNEAATWARKAIAIYRFSRSARQTVTDHRRRQVSF
jgi:hypothetical protein